MSAKKKETSHIECVVTGKRCFVRPDVLEQRIEKYGSLKALKEVYISRNALSLFKEGKTLDEVRAVLAPKFKKEIPNAAIKVIHEAQSKSPRKKTENKKTPPSEETSQEVNEPVTAKRFDKEGERIVIGPLNAFCASKIGDGESIQKLTSNDTCWFPGLFLDNKRHCDGCKFYEHCLCTLKTLKGSRNKHKELQE